MSWVCQCQREVPDSVPVCTSCFEERPRPARSTMPMYQEFASRPRPDSRPSDRCSECEKTVRDHIEEFRRYGQWIMARTTDRHAD